MTSATVNVPDVNNVWPVLSLFLCNYVDITYNNLFPHIKLSKLLFCTTWGMWCLRFVKNVALDYIVLN